MYGATQATHCGSEIQEEREIRCNAGRPLRVIHRFFWGGIYLCCLYAFFYEFNVVKRKCSQLRLAAFPPRIRSNDYVVTGNATRAPYCVYMFACVCLCVCSACPGTPESSNVSLSLSFQCICRYNGCVCFVCPGTPESSNVIFL